MTSLQLGLIIGGIVLVIGVIIYNWMQERRVRGRRVRSFDKAGPAATDKTRGQPGAGRVEPTLARGDDAVDALPIDDTTVTAYAGRAVDERMLAEAENFVPPVDFAPVRNEAFIEPGAEPLPDEVASAVPPPSMPPRGGSVEKAAQPDPDTECIVTLELQHSIASAELGVGLHSRLGKPLRWLGRTGPGMPWQTLQPETPGEFSEIIACLLLADRAGAVTRPLVERFIRLVSEIAATLPAGVVVPDAQGEAERAERLDRLCADLDVQIGLTVLKAAPGTIAGTRLRGVAEAAGFRLSDNGRFDWIQEDTGSVLYSLQNYRSEPFTAESLRLTSTPGAVFILDVPRVTDPVRVFDQMKLAAKRMTKTLDAALVDDNKHPLDDASLAAIREHVQATAAALREINVVPGSPRALALFGG
jgi:hypothetical protein